MNSPKWTLLPCGSGSPTPCSTALRRADAKGCRRSVAGSGPAGFTLLLLQPVTRHARRTAMPPKSATESSRYREAGQPAGPRQWCHADQVGGVAAAGEPSARAPTYAPHRGRGRRGRTTSGRRRELGAKSDCGFIWYLGNAPAVTCSEIRAPPDPKASVTPSAREPPGSPISAILRSGSCRPPKVFTDLGPQQRRVADIFSGRSIQAIHRSVVAAPAKSRSRSRGSLV